MENEIRDHYFVATCRSKKLQKTLLREQNLTLTELQEILEMRRLQIDKKLNDPIKMLSKTFYKGKGAPSDKKKF